MTVSQTPILCEADCIDWAAFKLAGEMNHCKSNILDSSHYEGRELLK